MLVKVFYIYYESTFELQTASRGIEPIKKKYYYDSSEFLTGSRGIESVKKRSITPYLY